MENKILELLNSGMEIEEVTEMVYENGCMAMKFEENFPSHCHEDVDCFDCWKQKVMKISESEDILKNNKEEYREMDERQKKTAYEDELRRLENEFRRCGYTDEVIEEIKHIEEATTLEAFVANLEGELSSSSE